MRCRFRPGSTAPADRRAAPRRPRVGSARFDGLDASLLEARIGDTALTVVEVTGPARRGAFALRTPATVRGFDRVALCEPVSLELALARAPPAEPG
jgi:hypothetical protein